MSFFCGDAACSSVAVKDKCREKHSKKNERQNSFLYLADRFHKRANVA